MKTELLLELSYELEDENNFYQEMYDYELYLIEKGDTQYGQNK